jgi:hypothetical protein
MTDTEYSYPFVDPLGEVVEVKVRGRQRREWTQDMAEEFGENSDAYRIRVLGEFGSGSMEVLIPRGSVLEAFDRGEVSAEGRLTVMGVDVAWTGNDNSACVVRCGENVIYAEDWHGCDLVETAARVEALADEYRPDAILVDTIGVGAGVYDMLRRRKLPVRAVATNVPPPDDGEAQCRTLRDWVWWRMRLMFRQRAAAMKGPRESQVWKRLTDELTGPTYTYKSGALRVESKDDMKKRGVRSPNLGDALALTMVVDWNVRTAKNISGLPAVAPRKRRLPVRRSWACV